MHSKTASISEKIRSNIFRGRPHVYCDFWNGAATAAASRGTGVQKQKGVNTKGGNGGGIVFVVRFVAPELRRLLRQS